MRHLPLISPFRLELYDNVIILYRYFLEERLKTGSNYHLEFVIKDSRIVYVLFCFVFVIDIFREDEPDVMFPTNPCTPLSTLRPPPVPE